MRISKITPIGRFVMKYPSITMRLMRLKCFILVLGLQNHSKQWRNDHSQCSVVEGIYKCRYRSVTKQSTAAMLGFLTPLLSPLPLYMETTLGVSLLVKIKIKGCWIILYGFVIRDVTCLPPTSTTVVINNIGILRFTEKYFTFLVSALFYRGGIWSPLQAPAQKESKGRVNSEVNPIVSLVPTLLILSLFESFNMVT